MQSFSISPRFGLLMASLVLAALEGCGSSDEASDGASGSGGSAAGSSNSAGTTNAGMTSVAGNAGVAGGALSTAGSTSTAGSSSSGASGAASAGAGGSAAGSGGIAGAAIDENGGAPGGPSSTRHTPRLSGTVAGTKIGYWEYLPPHYGNGAKYPLLVFNHGIGENGDGGMVALTKVPVAGPPMLIKGNKWPEERQFVVLSPQHNGNNDCPSASEIDGFIAFAMKQYDVDPKRVYLTGLSCGAIGSWNYLGAHTNEVVAAAVLISGDGRGAFNQAGCALGKVPLWAFHGDMDMTVLPVGSTEPLGKLAKCMPLAVDAKLTIYPGVGHSGWNQTYDLSAGHDIYTWLLSHPKP